MTVKNMGALERAANLIGSQGFLKAFLPSLSGDFAAAMAEGVTPGVWMMFGGVVEEADQLYMDYLGK